MSGAADNDGIILIGDSATLTASGGTSYNWNTSGTDSRNNGYSTGHHDLYGHGHQ
jgi:hypothetical protein